MLIESGPRRSSNHWHTTQTSLQLAPPPAHHTSSWPPCAEPPSSALSNKLASLSDSVSCVMSILIGPMGIVFCALFLPGGKYGVELVFVYGTTLCLNAPPRANRRMTRQYAMPIIGAD